MATTTSQVPPLAGTQAVRFWWSGLKPDSAYPSRSWVLGGAAGLAAHGYRSDAWTVRLERYIFSRPRGPQGGAVTWACRFSSAIPARAPGEPNRSPANSSDCCGVRPALPIFRSGGGKSRGCRGRQRPDTEKERQAFGRGGGPPWPAEASRTVGTTGCRGVHHGCRFRPASLLANDSNGPA